MKKGAYQYLTSTNEWATVIALLAMTVVVLAAVILRYFFGITIRWTGELTRFVFIYLVFLGIPLAFREKTHVMVQFFVSFLPPGVQKWLQRTIDILIGVCITVIAISTVQMMGGKLGATLSPGLKIPRGFVYAAVPIGIVLLLIEIVRRLIKEKQR
jgi:C4-dicarboxylate transporter DctQ subunit